MRFYTGDESGLIKGVDIDANVSLLEAQSQAAKRARAAAKAKATLKPNEQAPSVDTSLAGVNLWTINGKVSRENSIDQMCATEWQTGNGAFAVGRKNGRLDIIAHNGEELFTFTDPTFSSKPNIKHNGKLITERRFVGLSAFNEHFLTCTNLGEVRYQSFNSNEATKLIKLPLDAFRMRTHDKQPNVFAVGGREHELSIWDAETVQAGLEFTKPKSDPIFKAKNVPLDYLSLRVPVWVTDMQFTSDNATSPTVAISTGYRQIRLYDARAQQRPVQDWEVSKHPIYHLLKSHTKPELFFADNVGNVQQVDMRTGQVTGALRGVSGAVKTMALSEDGSKIAVAGLDRYVRVYQADGMHLPLHRAYTKQRITSLLWDWSHKDFSTNEIEEQEAEDIWENMDKEALKPKKKRKSQLAH
ncbi:Ribosome biogenesis protein nsa1 (NOP7-associated protein 1) [Coemansia sp. RSA 989]|nr:WD40-repeat-containing domain protein [Coemansia mojavensis]KAJ1742903.1 Ribosome biogenesis protein nsa1 (NOP7-associated protein 1) [Coemansia sp. RSA 1086]KAJ1749299.1 Ribosome biogenesis protein nsa1 (NOP7-associated protein 1) [Coemansia sp. RSA 1821]KAJ1866074.1 Ribosome biogenesis protein nsa1 (NOP7-associated protein 1) [Coemansia sp. RSA 989]KAJ1873267.1 Ribosome biogenesis protein nsa1 (NOP7-associated protein 1) [Coemansia sp. RSA 990]KAJ2631399.1 Ribosome biogenesis protein nsa1